MEEDERFKRSKALYKNLDDLKDKTVLIAGLGGVGSFALQGIARNSIGRLILIDHDVIEPSNSNRQLIADSTTIGQKKTELSKAWVERINPEVKVIALDVFYDQDLNQKLDTYQIDYILDCIDSITSKKDLISYAISRKIPIISSMGMARKTDPRKIEILELEKTSYDPIAKELRIWKRKNGIHEDILVASSKEPPIKIEPGVSLPSSIFVPGTAGLLMARQCVEDLLHAGMREKEEELETEEEKEKEIKRDG